ncbi:o-succinylbenzoate synthase [Texcoconibacillus texcoconensis]|uniref:o-succinylbenzoate synthase n=1 Tax=Texcoconibacillus texcoconensis TaxID=1095777 RepID=A0A840QRC9_9BACI|nr:o-succinylbenzoate synthase [Texcoconibacillus texcoconensis]MBB5173883.1 O-succinylbenzoate synthase [Texcoconibacillus texcoconensis]
MKINEINLYKVKMRMKNPFTTSFGTEHDRLFLLVEVIDEKGQSGWGECVTSERPLYIEEFTESSWLMLKKFLIPSLLRKDIEHPDELQAFFRPYKRNHLAKSALEGAVWDLYAKRQGVSLTEALGGVKSEIDVGVSLGIEDDIDQLLANIQGKVDEGYKRIKVKIKPGKDVRVLEQIREEFPDIPLMADANSAYTLEDVETLKAMDPFNLMMIEQPLAAGDLIDHAKLQKELKTPICLDESIHSYEDVRKAIELDSGRIINLKIGRVGGLTQAKKIHDLCEQANVPMWCGGMLESGVGRAHNIAITSLANFTLPGDTAASARYWDKDIIEPEVTVNQGVLTIPDAPGIGYEVNRDEVKKRTIQFENFQ